MIRIVKTIALSTILATAGLNAGKNVTPAESPVAPVVNPLPLYVGVGLLWSGTSLDCLCSTGKKLKDTTYGGILRVGYDFNEYIGVEARVLRTFMGKTFAETTHYGIYLVPPEKPTNHP